MKYFVILPTIVYTKQLVQQLSFFFYFSVGAQMKRKIEMKKFEFQFSSHFDPFLESN